MKPIIKWLGGKSQSLDIIKEMMPPTYTRYYEPFLGGGALLLDLAPTEAYVNDINSELINMYVQVREDVEAVIKELSMLDYRHSVWPDQAEYYYAVRFGFNHDLGQKTAKQAARFIYLNKHCFNGLYRVNRKGEFNVPFNGKKTGSSFDAEHLREMSKQIHDVLFMNADFEDCVYTADIGSFIFIDPPYDESFTDYTGNGFVQTEQARVANMFKKLSDKGCYCMLTNHDTPLIRELYKDYNIKVIDVRRSINRNGNDRKGKEVIITNY